MVYWLHDHVLWWAFLYNFTFLLRLLVESLRLRVKNEMSKKDLPPESEKILKKCGHIAGSWFGHREIIAQ